MLPVATLIATTAMLSGIGGAALFTPLFVIVFPLLGPQYPLESTITAIAAALMTGSFGSLSGFIGYYRKNLIDFSIARNFLTVSIPVAIIGAFVAHFINDKFLLAGYSILVFVLALVIIFFRPRRTTQESPNSKSKSTSFIVASTGTRYEYDKPAQNIFSVILTSIGAFLTGLLSVGIGEVVIAQLTKRGVPVPVAAATSVAIGSLTLAAASTAVICQLINTGGLAAVPWNLVIYTVPGVLIGGQIGPRLQGHIPQRSLELAIGTVFISISAAMMIIATR